MRRETLRQQCRTRPQLHPHRIPNNPYSSSMAFLPPRKEIVNRNSTFRREVCRPIFQTRAAGELLRFFTRQLIGDPSASSSSRKDIRVGRQRLEKGCYIAAAICMTEVTPPARPGLTAGRSTARPQRSAFGEKRAPDPGNRALARRSDDQGRRAYRCRSSLCAGADAGQGRRHQRRSNAGRDTCSATKAMKRTLCAASGQNGSRRAGPLPHVRRPLQPRPLPQPPP